MYKQMEAYYRVINNGQLGLIKAIILINKN